MRYQALKLGPRSSGLHTTRNVAEARSTSNVFQVDADDPGRACNRKRKRQSDEDIDDAQQVEADGEDNAEERVMTYKQVGRRSMATLAIGDRSYCRVLVPDNQTEGETGEKDERS